MDADGWDDRGCPLYTLTAAEADRVQAVAVAAAEKAAEVERARDAQRVAEDIARREKKALALGDVVVSGRRRSESKAA